jgi:hypothetical protein
MHAMAQALLEWETIDASRSTTSWAGKPPRPPAQGLDAAGQQAQRPDAAGQPDGAPAAA